jgi:L-alanine-DL-glutamate epimerase-like enolase superfamily enzyme
MKTMSRRTFLRSTAAAAGTLAAARSVWSENDPLSQTQGRKVRNHPLQGVARENIKITDVRVRLFSYKIPIEDWWYGAGITILTEVFTDKGIVGIGGPSVYAGPEFVKDYTEKYIHPAVVGKNPFDLEFIAPGDVRPTHSPAWAGVNVACWDIVGKVKNRPVYELLATNAEPQTRMLHYASAGTLHNWAQRPEELYDEALRYKEEGYKAFKFRLGVGFEEKMTIKKYAPFLRKLREAVGWDFGLIHENSMRLNLEECLALAPALEELKFLWLEEPVNRWGGYGRLRSGQDDIPKAISAYAKICEALPTVKVSGGESMTTRYEFKDWIEQDAYDIVQPDCDTTGLSEGWYIAQMAHVRGKSCAPHNWQGGLSWMANIQLAAAIPNRMMLECSRHYNPFREGLFKEPIVVKNSYAQVPSKPGLGVEIIDDADRKFPYDPNNHWLKLLSP